MSDVQAGVFTAWPEGRKAMLAVDAACDAGGLPPQLIELVRLWCSVLNDCAFCIAMHQRKAKALGVADAFIEAIVEQRDRWGLDDGARTALDYATALTNLVAIDEAKAALADHFDHQQIVMLSYAIAQINAWNRLAISDATFNQLAPDRMR
jgi:AhpD family alkylhydroperoxidase